MMRSGKVNVQPHAPGVDEASRRLLREIAGESAKELNGYAFPWHLKVECERILSLLTRLAEDIERKSKTLVPGSSGSSAMIILWQAELQLIEARIKKTVQAAVELSQGDTRRTAQSNSEQITNGYKNIPTKVPPSPG